MRRCWHRSLTCAVVLLLFSAVMVLVGCGRGNGEGTGDAVAMMKKLPKDAGLFSFTNLAAIRADDDLGKLYENFKEKYGSVLEELGMPADNVDCVVQSESLTILEGYFDLGQVSEVLEGKGYGDAEYKGIQTWEDPFLSYALVSGSCIVGGYDIESVKECADVINGVGDSLYDDTDLRDLMGRLPGGFALTVFSGYEEQYEGLEAHGYSLAKKSADTVRITAIFRFGDADEAGAAVDDVEAMINEETGGGKVTDVGVTREGKYVKASAIMAMDDAP